VGVISQNGMLRSEIN